MSQVLRCANHPAVETYLRCNRCGKPICSKCAVRTPVGYRCKECVRLQQSAFYSGFRLRHYLLTAAVALPLSFVAGWIIPRAGWFAIILGPIAGSGIAQAARWAVRRRRGLYVWVVVCISIFIGALPALLDLGQSSPIEGRWALSHVMDRVWLGVYWATAIAAAYSWLRPGRRV